MLCTKGNREHELIMHRRWQVVVTDTESIFSRLYPHRESCYITGSNTKPREGRGGGCSKGKSASLQAATEVVLSDTLAH